MAQSGLVSLCFGMRGQHSRGEEVAGAFDAIVLTQTGKVEVDGLVVAKRVSLHRVRDVIVDLVNGLCQEALATRALVGGLGDSTSAGTHSTMGSRYELL